MLYECDGGIMTDTRSVQFVRCNSVAIRVLACTYYASTPDAVADVVAGHVGADGRESERNRRHGEQNVEQ